MWKYPKNVGNDEKWRRNDQKTKKSWFQYQLPLNKFNTNCTSNLTPELTFSDQRKIDPKFSRSNFVRNLCFLDLEHAPYSWKHWKLPIFTRKTPKIHVKRDKNGRKYTFFSVRQHIKYTFEVCWLDPISLFSRFQNRF